MKKKKKTPANNFNDEKLFFKKTLPILTVLYYIFFVEKRPFLTKIKSNQNNCNLYYTKDQCIKNQKI